jgi:hypothetical protein
VVTPKTKPKRSKARPLIRRISKADRVVAIAKDALRTVALVRVSPGTYFEVADVKVEPSKTHFNRAKNLKKCEVCAVGILFLGHLRVFDKINIADSWSAPIPGADPGGVSFDRDFMADVMKKYITPQQLDLMEAAFERTVNLAYSDVSFDELFAASDFGKQYDDPKDRLRAILRNVVKNRGVFNPYQ